MSVSELLGEAQTATGKVVANITPDQLGASTPCPDWDVRTLLNHLVAVNLFFASVAEGTVPDREPFFEQNYLSDDLASSYDDSITRVRAAFDAPGASEKDYELPGFTMPGSALQAITLSDNVVHGWDLATATGQQLAVSDDLALATMEAIKPLPMAQPEARGRTFAQIVDVPDDAPALDKLIAFAGRTP